MKVNNIEQFKACLKEYSISPDDVCLCGSVALAVANIRENGDVDFAMRSKEREELKSRLHDNYAALRSDGLCFDIMTDRYLSLGLHDDDLFLDDNSFLYEGFRVVRLEVELAKKILRGLSKDELDFELLYKKGLSNKIDWMQVYSLINSNKKTNEDRRRINPKIEFKALRNRIINLIAQSYLFKKNYSMTVQTTELLLNSVRYGRVDVALAVLYLIDNDNELIKTYSIDEKTIKHECELRRKGIRRRIVINARNGIPMGKGYDLAAAVLLNEDTVSINLGYAIKKPSIKTSPKDDTNEKKRIENLLIREGAFFCGIVYGGIIHDFDKIVEDIEQHNPIIKTLVHKCSSENEYIELIEAIYKVDNTEDWKIQLKKIALNTYAKECGIILFDVINPKFRYNDRTGLWLSDTCAKMKKEIRRCYVSKGIQEDAIIHITDNYISNKKMIREFERLDILI